MSWSRSSGFTGCATDTLLGSEQPTALPSIMDGPSSENGGTLSSQMNVISDTLFYFVFLGLIAMIIMWIPVLRRHWLARRNLEDPESPMMPESPNYSGTFILMPLPAEASGSQAEKQLDNDSEVKPKLMSTEDNKRVRVFSFIPQSSVAVYNHDDNQCSLFIETGEQIHDLGKMKRSNLKSGKLYKKSIYDGIYPKDV